MKKKKVSFVIHSLQAGGMERVMSEIVNYFSQTGKYEVYLIIFGKKREVFYQLADDIIIVKPHFEFDESRRVISSLKTMIFLRKKNLEIRPVFVLTFGELWNNFVLLSLFKSGIPVFVSDRAQPNKSIGFFNELLRKILYPTAKGVIAQTSRALEIFRKKYKNSNFTVIGNPIRNIQIKETEKKNYILMVGRYIASKQQDKLIEIFSKLDAPDWKLILLGYDHLHQNNQIKWEQIAADLNVTERVVFTGKQADVDYYYLVSSIFAFTSASEGFPNVVGEAMSAGLPVVAYDCVAGPGELINENVSGFLVPLNDERMFIERLQYFVNNPDQRMLYGQMGKKAMSKFELNYICKKYEKFLTQELNN